MRRSYFDGSRNFLFTNLVVFLFLVPSFQSLPWETTRKKAKRWNDRDETNRIERKRLRKEVSHSHEEVHEDISK